MRYILKIVPVSEMMHN